MPNGGERIEFLTVRQEALNGEFRARLCRSGTGVPEPPSAVADSHASVSPNGAEHEPATMPPRPMVAARVGPYERTA